MDQSVGREAHKARPIETPDRKERRKREARLKGRRVNWRAEGTR